MKLLVRGGWLISTLKCHCYQPSLSGTEWYAPSLVQTDLLQLKLIRFLHMRAVPACFGGQSVHFCPPVELVEGLFSPHLVAKNEFLLFLLLICVIIFSIPSGKNPEL